VSSSIAFCPKEPSPDDLRIGLCGLGADREGQPHPHRAKWNRIEPVTGDKGRDRLTTQFKFLLPVDNEARGTTPGLAGVTSPAAKRRPER